MKKTFLLLTGLLFSVVASNAQDAVEMKKGTWGIRVDAISVFKSIGNAFYQDAGDGATFPYGLNFDGRYFVNDNKAIRLGIGLEIGSNETKMFNDGNDDVLGTTSSNGQKYELNAGFEMRKTFNRLHLLYGPMVGFSTTMGSAKIDPSNSSDKIKTTLGSNYLIGAGGFLGVEYFIAERISLGAEFNYAFTYEFTGRDKTETQSETVKSGNESKSLGLGSFNGMNVNVGFYF